MAAQEVVGLDVAEAELQRMLDALDYEPEESEKDAFLDAKRGILKALMAGDLTIDEAGLPTIALRYPVGKITHVTFRRPTGGIIMTIGAGDKDAAAVNTTLADLIGLPTAIVSKMDYRTDYKLAGKVMSLFLG